MMNNKKTLLIYGFLLINGVHWGALVFTALFSNVVAIFVTYDQLPWLRLLTLIIEIIVIVKFLDKQESNKVISEKSVFRLMIISVVLFVCAQFRFYFEFSPFFCGLGLLELQANGIFENRDQNENYVSILETMILSMVILIYVYRQIKKNNLI